jgi:DeoR/GlpR family transcriptional regulator of sugar metabolism
MAIFHREDAYIKILTERTHTVKELATKLFISEPTVRRDVLQLKKKELVICVNGKVSLKISSPDSRIPMFIRDYENTEAKKIMAIKASEYVHDGDIIMLDASTSAYALLPHLANFKNLFVITSGAKTSIALSAMGIKNLCTGGEAIPESFSFIGADAERTLSNYNANIAFFSCRGINEKGIVSDNSIGENNIRRIMIERAQQRILLCDSSKLNKSYLNTLCNVCAIDNIICETPLPDTIKQLLPL